MKENKQKVYQDINPDGDDRYGKNDTNSVPGINTPEISLPAFNPPVPNRAWTAMRAGKDIDELTDEERMLLYYGKDQFI